MDPAPSCSAVCLSLKVMDTTAALMSLEPLMREPPVSPHLAPSAMAHRGGTWINARTLQGPC